MNHCYIIGGAGFIGSHLASMLTFLNREVTIVDVKPKPPKRFFDQINYIVGDYSHPDFLKDTIRKDAGIVYLAQSGVPRVSFNNPHKVIIDNLSPAIELFETASQMDIRKLVLVSSGGTVYGKSPDRPIDEDQPTWPISPYGITKLAAEKCAHMYHELKALPVVTVRPGNAYGEGQAASTGQGFVTTAIASICKGDEVVIFGESGMIRDYIHVSDVASGILAALDGGNTGSCYNIGTGIGMSNIEVLESMKSLADEYGKKILVRKAPARPYDVPYNVLDSTRLRKQTGWYPKISFKEGLLRTWNNYLAENSSDGTC